jgi:hypothetical protein
LLVALKENQAAPLNNKENQDALTNFVRTKKNQAVKLGFLYSLLIEMLGFFIPYQTRLNVAF